MPSRQNIFFFLSLIAALALGAGCSSSQTAGDDGYMDMGNSPESGADAVGSIPEDMLANDEASTEPSETGATDTAAAETPSGSDPFADLAENESVSKDALEVTEEGGAATTGATDHYSVKAGDTLMKIAFTIYGDIDRWKDLRDWNQGAIKNASRLKVGTKLTYETPLQAFNAEELSHSYLIKQGDTLAGIADEVYGRKKKYVKLQKYNKKLIKNPNRIFAGFTIFYDITDKEMADAEARRQERMANGGGAFPGQAPMANGAGGDDFNLLQGDSSVPSALSPPKPASSGSAPIAISPSGVSPIAPPGSVQPIAPPSH